VIVNRAKVIRLSKDRSHTEKRKYSSGRILNVGFYKIEEPAEIKYLGSIGNFDANLERKVTTRIGTAYAGSAFTKPSKVWKNCILFKAQAPTTE